MSMEHGWNDDNNGIIKIYMSELMEGHTWHPRDVADADHIEDNQNTNNGHIASS